MDLVGPCTNCARTSKQCTFEWVQSQQLQRKERQSLAVNGSNAAYNVAAAAPTSRKVARTLSPDVQSARPPSPTPSHFPLRPLRPTVPTLAYEQPPSSQPCYLFQSQPQPDHHMLMDSSCSYPTATPDGFDLPPPVPGVAFVDGSLTTTSSTTSIDLSGVSGPGIHANVHAVTHPLSAPSYMNVCGDLPDYGFGSFATTDQHQQHHADNFADPGASVWPSPGVSSPAQSDDAVHAHGAVRKRRRTQSPAAPMTVMTAASPAPHPSHLWADDRLSRSTNGNLIGKIMMRIYHDVMEGALSCWLTEKTCPYNSMPPTPPPSMDWGSRSNNHYQYPPFWGGFEDMQTERGMDWSNRIYRRVVRLDRVTHLMGLKRLRPADENRVATALNAAVMAFTAQWAQNSSRSNARWPPNADENGGDIFRPPDLNIGEEFDRTLQKSLWNQARKSLNDCSEIDSFRVVFAEIIFGLTQKYGESSMDHDDMGDLDKNGSTTLERVEEILREDNQQIWLERATRRLHVLRRRVELHDRQLRNLDTRSYDVECRKTIDLLFWLVVMFDTISAAMTERPLTISDEDSSNLALVHRDPRAAAASAVTDDTSQRWNVILAKDQTKTTPLRFPCTEMEIQHELTDAAPVKVLLYRKVTRLQTLVSREVVARAAVEEAIGDALMVYSHWQTQYGALFADCLVHHEMLDACIQSWYVCLFGHWLLATLLLADLIEAAANHRGFATIGAGGAAAEEGGDGTHAGAAATGTAWTAKVQQAASIRRSSVRLISDLARASTPRHDPGRRLENYHAAVNDGALLTEPWTMILLRTFSRAAIILLDDLPSSQPWRPAAAAAGQMGAEREEATDGEEERGSFARCEDCVKALWYLGRKSDMAREVAGVLRGALQNARAKFGQ